MLTRGHDHAGHVALLDLVVDPGERERELVVREADVGEVRVDPGQVLGVDVDVQPALVGILVVVLVVHGSGY
jgi:hypothetical protein